MESQLDWHQAKALLEWQIELGATEAILDAPVNRFELTDKAPPKSQPRRKNKHLPHVSKRLIPLRLPKWQQLGRRIWPV